MTGNNINKLNYKVFPKHILELYIILYMQKDGGVVLHGLLTVGNGKILRDCYHFIE